ncbi:MAG: DUF2948 family protein [Rhizobiaceae bacterium]
MTKDLKLLAMDAEDLTVVSAHLQDAVMRVEDLVFSGGDGKLLLGLNRFTWEAKPVRRFFSRQYGRRRSILQIDRITGLRSKGVDRSNKDAVLSILTVTFHSENVDDPSGVITITFSGEASLQARVECIEVRLSDQGGAWAASSHPRHHF